MSESSVPRRPFGQQVAAVGGLEGIEGNALMKRRVEPTPQAMETHLQTLPVPGLGRVLKRL
jgi:hypothetical protein